MKHDDNNGVIRFYSATGEYGCFSNFSDHPVVLKGKRWPTTEHYFQAQKFAGTKHEKVIRRARSASQAAMLGRERSRPLRRDWEQKKDSVMFDAVMAKFSQHPDLRDTLLATGSRRIVEHSANDRYWADGGDGSGRNRLGEILMRVRAILRRGNQTR